MGEYANKAMGKTKKTVGKLTGNRSLEARGTAQEYVGKAEGGAKKLGRTVERAAERLGNKAANRRPAPRRR